MKKVEKRVFRASLPPSHTPVAPPSAHVAAQLANPIQVSRLRTPTFSPFGQRTRARTGGAAIWLANHAGAVHRDAITHGQYVKRQPADACPNKNGAALDKGNDPSFPAPIEREGNVYHHVDQSRRLNSWRSLDRA